PEKLVHVLDGGVLVGQDADGVGVARRRRRAVPLGVVGVALQPAARELRLLAGVVVRQRLKGVGAQVVADGAEGDAVGGVVEAVVEGAQLGTLRFADRFGQAGIDLGL